MINLLYQPLDRAAERSPDHDAVRFQGQGLTYAQLSTRSNQVARLLAELGVQRGDRVGLFMTKGLECITAVYGILKAGAAYVPLDVAAPPERLAFQIRDCGVEVLFANKSRLGPLKRALKHETGLRHVVGLDADLGPVEALPFSSIEAMQPSLQSVGTIENDLAYILYTSGTTGEPKGMMLDHRAGLSFAEWGAATYDLTPDDRVSNTGPFHFDLSVFDYYGAALAGATTIIIPEAFMKLPASLSQVIESERISVMYTVPLALLNLMERGAMETRDLTSLRWILFAGEAFATKHLRSLMAKLPDARFSHLYGVTEANVCTYWHVEPLSEDNDDPIPLGHILPHLEGVVVDDDDREVAPGETGELLIRGPALMEGYFNRPDLNRQVRRVFPSPSGFERVFHRTGDLLMVQHDGLLRFVGRKDRMIKTRGHRVELDEVEVALVAHDDVEEAVAFAAPDGRSSVLIVAAVVGRPGVELDEKDVLRSAAAKLPGYAMPSRLHVMSTFPRTTAGKIDRRRIEAELSDA